MNHSNASLASWVSVCVLLAACSSSGENPSTESEFLTCDQGTVKVTGTLQGTPVDITQNPSGSGFSQLNGGQFCTQCIGGSHDPARIDVTLQWMGLVPDGATADATGEVVMPTTGPLAGEKLCAGTGTRIRMARDGEPATLQFIIRGITGAAGCTEARSGELRGCYHSSFP
jgi:hypothetical protein